jgi:hypothetical protein
MNSAAAAAVPAATPGFAAAAVMLGMPMARALAARVRASTRIVPADRMIASARAVARALSSPVVATATTAAVVSPARAAVAVAAHDAGGHHR